MRKKIAFEGKVYVCQSSISAEYPEINPANLRYATLGLDIVSRFNYLLQTKMDGNMDLLAQKMDMPMEKVSDLITGMEGFNLRHLCMLEAAFGESIIEVEKSNTEDRNQITCSAAGENEYTGPKGSAPDPYICFGLTSSNYTCCICLTRIATKHYPVLKLEVCDTCDNELKK